jgi:type II secretory pathway component GspD/PulD (secretin)
VTWRMVADVRTNSLIIRGTEKDLQMAADLIAVLDVPADKPVPNVKNVSAFKLKFAPAAETAAILQGLELGAQIVPDERGNIVIVAGPEAVRKEIGELIQALDVEGLATPKRRTP